LADGWVCSLGHWIINHHLHVWFPCAYPFCVVRLCFHQLQLEGREKKNNKTKKWWFLWVFGYYENGEIICQIVSRYLEHHLHSGNQTWLAGESMSDRWCLLISH
jgi:hypothetical protein